MCLPEALGFIFWSFLVKRKTVEEGAWNITWQTWRFRNCYSFHQEPEMLQQQLRQSFCFIMLANTSKIIHFHQQEVLHDWCIDIKLVSASFISEFWGIFEGQVNRNCANLELGISSYFAFSLSRGINRVTNNEGRKEAWLQLSDHRTSYSFWTPIKWKHYNTR